MSRSRFGAMHALAVDDSRLAILKKVDQWVK